MDKKEAAQIAEPIVKMEFLLTDHGLQARFLQVHVL